MTILFIHQNFPGQFQYLAPALAADPTNIVFALTMRKVTSFEWKGVNLISYSVQKRRDIDTHLLVKDFETKAIRAEGCFRVALELKAQGIVPDVIISNPGWGESMFVKDVWPDAKLGIYCEFYYHQQNSDIDFDPEFPVTNVLELLRIRMKNINLQIHFDVADAGISPTQWQKSLFPESFRSKIEVIHDGIDTDKIIPNPDISIALNDDIVLNKSSEVVTFVSRNLEPYRGYHIFMRSLPALLKCRPKLRILIIGGDGVSYGGHPKDSQSWRNIFLNEIRPLLSESEWNRIHFLGHVSYTTFIPLLQVSSVHVYLTYPFVLSWSLLEAMSIECAIVASDTSPVREVIIDKETGRLVNFFDFKALSNEIIFLLENPDERSRLGQNARLFVQKHYDLTRVCLPQQIEWIKKLLHK